MENADIVLVFVVLSSAITLLVALWRHRSFRKGPILISLVTLALAAGAWFSKSSALLYFTAGVWIAFTLLPSLLSRLYQKQLVEQNHASVYRLARVIAVLHPFDGWKEQPEIARAIGLAHRGEIAAAVEILKRFENVTSPSAVSAMATLFRITNRWEEFLAWSAQLPGEVQDHISFVIMQLRARAEVGDVSGMIGLYERRKGEIGSLFPASSRDLCRLVLFAFTGRGELVERLFLKTLAGLPEHTKDFWRATAVMAAGEVELAREKFEALKGKSDAMTRQAIEQRLSRGLAPTSLLTAREIAFVDEAAVEHRHEEVFAARPSLFSRAALGVQLLIAANLAMFGLEIFAGGATEGDVLFRLGAMYAPAVHAGEWWRLVASMFLHFGLGHLVFNLMALAVLGPFVEGAFRYVKFLAVYFLSGVGSMLVVMALTRWEEYQLTVGASGAILGLAGATAALMLKGWRRERAQQARKRLWTLVLIIVLQTVIDLMTPQISMTAHLSGAVIGFVVAMILRDHLPREGGVIATAS